MKYVALLAFNKIVVTHPYLVAQQEDVIMDCIDSADISIRMRALDLVVGMVNSDNLMSVVGRLMRQLRNSPIDSNATSRSGRQNNGSGIEPAADSDEEDPEESLRPSDKGMNQAPPLPEDYRIDVIGRILSMCSNNNYGNLVDFDWYLDILTQLVRNAPISQPSAGSEGVSVGRASGVDVTERIGDELRNVAVKVKAIRPAATKTAEGIVIASHQETSSQHNIARGALRSIIWVVGEYASSLVEPENVLSALLYLCEASSAEVLAVILQAITKIFAFISGDHNAGWTPERKSMMELLMARVLHVLEPMVTHPHLEVQERVVEFTELLKLAAEAAHGQATSTDVDQNEAPLLLTQAIPSLFAGLELNSVALSAQRNVPMPVDFDLDQPINPKLGILLNQAESAVFEDEDHDEFESFYHQRPANTTTAVEPAANRLGEKTEEHVSSYQQGGEDSYLDPDIIARRRAERRERNKDDPYYIPSSNEDSGTSTPLHSILQSSNGQALDVDSIPIMQLDIGSTTAPTTKPSRPKKPAASVQRQRILVSADEDLSGNPSAPSTPNPDVQSSRGRPNKGPQSFLQVDSSNIGSFSLEGDDNGHGNGAQDYEARQREEEEMMRAMKEVERLRLEMQRANERIQVATGVEPEGTMVKRKVKRKVKTKVVEGEGITAVAEGAGAGDVVKRKKKKKAVAVDGDGIEGAGEGEGEGVGEIVKPRKKKKKAQPVVEESGEGDSELAARHEQ